MNTIYIFNETAKYKFTVYNNVTIEWVDGILSDEETDELSNISIKDMERKRWRVYKNKVKKLTAEVDKHYITGYDETKLLKSEDIKNGIYTFNTSNKLVIDHKISIVYGYKNNIPIEHIADISNLRYIPSCDNQSKSRDVFIDELNEWILPKQKNIL
jgi:hypothetical protein